MSFLGVLMLDTAFPRIEGDAGNPASYSMPVRVMRVEGADVPQIVRGAPPDAQMVARFIAAAQALEAKGASGLVTTCGFNAHVQQQLSAAVGIPVLASALAQGPLVKALTGGRKIGVLTADATEVTDALLAGAGLRVEDVAVAGLEDAPVWQDLILKTKAEQSQSLDPEEIGALVEAKALALMGAHPDLGAILFECANLPPYAQRVRAATGLPVFHILQGAEMIWNAANASPTSQLSS